MKRELAMELAVGGVSADERSQPQAPDAKQAQERHGSSGLFQQQAHR